MLPVLIQIHSETEQKDVGIGSLARKRTCMGLKRKGMKGVKDKMRTIIKKLISDVFKI